MPSGYRETKVILAVVVLLICLGTVIGPIVAVIDSSQTRYLALISSIFFSCVTMISLLFFPKLLAASSDCGPMVSTDNVTDDHRPIGAPDFAVPMETDTLHATLRLDLSRYRAKTTELTEKLMLIGNRHGGIFVPPAVEIDHPLKYPGRKRTKSYRKNEQTVATIGTIDV